MEVIYIHRQAGFNIRNFRSNCSHRALNESSDDEEHCSFKSEGNILDMESQSKSDIFNFCLRLDQLPQKNLSFEKVPTKRQLI